MVWGSRQTNDVGADAPASSLKSLGIQYGLDQHRHQADEMKGDAVSSLTSAGLDHNLSGIPRKEQRVDDRLHGTLAGFSNSVRNSLVAMVGVEGFYWTFG